jgi:hypothetical protein
MAAGPAAVLGSAVPVIRFRYGQPNVSVSFMTGALMADLIFTVLTVGVFAVLTLVLRGVERL